MTEVRNPQPLPSPSDSVDVLLATCIPPHLPWLWKCMWIKADLDEIE